MKKLRARIPPDVAAGLLFENKHQCCICREPNKPVHIHHIDDNPANSDPQNLAVLCLDHHSAVTGNEGLGRDYSRREIRLFKVNWEAECENSQSHSSDESDWSEAEIVEPIHSLKKSVVLGGDEHLYHSFELEAGDEIDFSLSSSEPIEFLIMTRSQYDHWLRDGEGVLYEQHSDISELEDSFEVPTSANWLLIFCNDSDEEVEVRFSISTWPGE
jgi:hypothetical protein